SSKAMKRADCIWSADTVGDESRVALEPSERRDRRGSEDAVHSTGIEPEGAEPLLQLLDVVAALHRLVVIEEAIAEPVAGFDQRVPCLRSADAVAAQAPLGL